MEAEHLRRFSNNFRTWNGVSFPQPADAPLVSQEVLVETFEEGEHISSYVGTPGGKYNKKLAGGWLRCTTSAACGVPFCPLYPALWPAL